MSKKKITVSLVLGSGGARGLAHIGVIKWLVDNNYEIKSISGSSIGALIGGIYASGNLDKYEKWVCGVSKIDIISLLDFAWNANGLVHGDKIINTLIELLGDQLIEDLPLSFTAVASDIENEKEIWINSGSLFDAIRASISMPLFFTPVRSNGRLLIDGGVLNPMPIAPTFGDQTDLIIAVSLAGGREKESITVIEKAPKAVKNNQESSKHDIHIHEKIFSFINNFISSNDDTKNKLEDSPYWGAFDIVNQSLDAMQSTITRQKLASYPADYIIDIPRNSCGSLEFNRGQEMIDLGYKKAQLCMPSKDEQFL